MGYTTVKLSLELRDKLKREAKAEGRTMVGFIRYMLEQYIQEKGNK